MFNVMATIKTFEEIEAWQQARSLAGRIHKLTQEGSFARDFKLINQINGASGSVMDNIAEGFERGGTREFVQFLSIAKGSAGEVRSQLYRAMDRSHITQETFYELKSDVIIISKLLSGLINYPNTSGMKGSKFIREPSEVYSGDGLWTLNLEK